MIISFANLDHEILVEDGCVRSLRIEDPLLFGRVCQSLLSGGEEDAIEPYSVWGTTGERIKASDSMIVVQNPFDLPWDHKSLQGSLHKKIVELAKEDEESFGTLRMLDEKQREQIISLAFQLDGTYGFALEWNLSSILKSCKFGVLVQEDAPLLDKLIDFVDFAADMKIDEALVFINLKTFLTKNDLSHLCNRLFFHRISALFLENQAVPVYHEMEREYVVDRDFIEYESIAQEESSSSLQGRICSDGFGAVAF